VRTAQRALIAACIACAAALPATAPAKGFRYTHSVTLSGQVNDSWSRTAVDNCSLQGSGTTTVSFAWKGAWKVGPIIDPHSGAHGRWVLMIKLADYHDPRPANVFDDPLALPSKTILVADLPSRLTSITTAFTGGATRVGSDCDPPEGRPCAGRTFTKKSNLSGVDRRRLSFNAFFNLPVSEDACTTGTVDGWSSTVFKNQDDVFIRMPKPTTLKRRKTVVLTGKDSGHQKIELDGSQLDETVTRTVTVTFKKL
jgi:hypothetical protein